MALTTLRKVAAALMAAGSIVLVAAGVALAADVGMIDDDFSPAQTTIQTGDSVTFTNQGESPHTATADDGSFDTGGMDPGASASVTFETAGTYRYYCQFHGGPGGEGMAGVITVNEANGGGGGDGGGNGGGGGAGTPTPEAGPVLPQTATPLPILGAAGGVMLLSGLLLGRRRRAR